LEKALIILIRDVREKLKSMAFLIICIISSLITIAASVATSVILSRKPWVGMAEARPILELIIGLMSFFIPLIIMMIFIWGFSGLQLISEKTKGIISSLIAANITPRQLWIGKSLAIFIPGYLISIISTATVILSINLSVIVPASGSFIFPLPLFLMSLVWDPLLLLGTLLSIILFSLAGNPDIAIAPSFIVGFGLMMGVPIGMTTGWIDLVSWDFSLWFLAGTAVVWIAVIILTRFLTRENIILSSKGS